MASLIVQLGQLASRRPQVIRCPRDVCRDGRDYLARSDGLFVWQKSELRGRLKTLIFKANCSDFQDMAV